MICYLVRSCQSDMLQYKKLISEHSAFPLVIVQMQQQEAWKQETSDMHKFRRDEISTGSFVCMEENITTIKKLQKKIITKLQEVDITLIRSVSQRRMKMREKEMENDKVVTHHFEEEDMSWKTTMQWCVNSSNKRRTQKDWHQPICTISMLSKHHYAKIWNNKGWKWD